MKKRILLNSKSVFIITLIVIGLTSISVWVYGLGEHRTIIENSLITTSILSISFFLFISIGLYNGVKLQDTLGKITDNFDVRKLETLKGLSKDSTSSSELPIIGDDIGGVIIGIILWIVVAFIVGFLFYVFGAVVWITILIFTAMLYWVFFRALRLVFKKANQCKGKIVQSIGYGLGYTLLYNFWIYLIIALSNR